MTFTELRKILLDNQLSAPERSIRLQTSIKSLYEEVDPEDDSPVNADPEALVALEKYLVASRDEDVLNEVLALLRNLVPFSETLRSILCKSSLNETLAQLVLEGPLTEHSAERTVRIYNRFLQYAANSVASDESLSQYFFSRLILASERPLLHVLQCGVSTDDENAPTFSRPQHGKLIDTAICVFVRMLQSESNWSAFLELEYFIEMVEAMIRETLRSSDPGAFELLKRIVATPLLFSVHFDGFGLQAQSFLLDLVAEQLTEVHPETPVPSLPEESIQFCIMKVKKSIEKLRNDRGGAERTANEVLFVKFLSVLALSSLRDSRGTLKNDLELLIMSIECLKTVHTLGKETSSEFHPKTDFNSLTGPEEEILEHPLFGIKRDLARLIGNMCYKNKLNQDTMRDFNGIELLCDMSSLDARNPLITQWVVLALKNLMDGNEENQRIVASLTRQTDL